MIRPKLFSINLDLKNRNYITDIIVSQGDQLSNVFRFNLVQDSLPYDLTGLGVKAYFERPDKLTSFITGQLVDASKGIVDVELTNQILNTPGVATCQVMIIGTAGELLSSLKISFVIEKSVNYTAIESTNEYNALIDAMSDVQSIRNDFETVIANATTDSEVILARGGFLTLRQRLDASDADVGSAEGRLDVLEANVDNHEDRIDEIELGKVDKIQGKQLSDENYSNDEKSKLSGIETGATGDMTALEIKTAYESNDDTNAYTDTEKNKVSNLPEDTNAQLSAIETEQNTQNNRLTDLEARAIKTYGARRTLNATSPLLERIFDAAGKSANVPTDDGAAVNDFDNIFPWSHIRECKRDATGRIHYKGDPGYDLLTNVDWLIEIPKFYIRMQRTATTFDRVISEIKRAGFWVPSVFKRADGTECDKIYVGRFKTGIVDGVDVSRPGIFPENFRDLASFRTGARAKGAGWQLIDISYKTEVLDMLYIIESATLNSQVYLGNGITTVRYVATDLAQIAETAVNRIVVTNAMAGNYNVGENICIGTVLGSENIARDRTILSKTALPDGVNTAIVFDGAPVNIAVGNVLWQGAQKNGQTMNLQKPNGRLSGVSGRTSNKYRGMEDIFGNVLEWVDGVLISERIAQICKDPAKFASTLTADYKPVGYTNLATDGYPLEMGFDSNFPEAIFPTTTGGGTSTGYCDYYHQNPGLRGAFFGGTAYDGSLAGVFYWNLSGTPTGASWPVGSRLLFKPPV